jgi:CheY-like chemotaxis protein
MQEAPAILVVDDEPDIREMLVYLLANEGYRLLEASNGQDALDILSRPEGEGISLILTDLMMPCMDGAQLIKVLRSRDRGREIPVILLSALTEATVRELTSQFQLFLRKPFTVERLLFAVNSLLPAPKGDRLPVPAVDAGPERQTCRRGAAGTVVRVTHPDTPAPRTRISRLDPRAAAIRSRRR